MELRYKDSYKVRQGKTKQVVTTSNLLTSFCILDQLARLMAHVRR